MTATNAERYERLLPLATHRCEWGQRTIETDSMIGFVDGADVWDLKTGKRVDFVDLWAWSNNAELVADLRAAGYEALGLKLLRRITPPTGH